MNSTLVVLATIVGAIGFAMALTAWRIRRLQYPPELRWPAERRRWYHKLRFRRRSRGRTE